MISRLPRIIAVVVFVLVALTWLFRGQSGSSYYDTKPRIQHLAERPQRAPPIPKTDTSRTHYADTPEPPPSPDDEPTSTSSFVPAPTTTPLFKRRSPYAYVFYATSDEYACSALINIDRLRGFHTPHQIYALVTDKVAKEYTQAMQDMNVTVSVTPPPAHPHARRNPKEQSLLKMMAFKMHHVNRDLRRVIVVDADQYIYHPLDSLFQLPSTDLAAPRAYWKGNHQISTSLMVISLSDRVWQMVDQGIQKLKENWYDTELVQDLFEDTVLMLPGQYAMIDQHFVDWDLPKWYRPEGDLHHESSVETYSKAQLEDLWLALEANAAKKPSTEAPKQQAGRPELVKLRKRDEDLGVILTPEQVKQEEEAHARAEAARQQETKPDEPKLHALPEPPQTLAPPKEAPAAPKLVAVNQAAPAEKERTPQELRLQHEAERQRQAAMEATRQRKAVEAQRQAAEAQRQQAESQRQMSEGQSHREEVLGVVPSGIDRGFVKPAQAAVPKPAASQPPPHPYKPDTHPNRGHLGMAHSQAVVFHFGAVYKPWQRDYDAFKKERPNLFPGIFESFRHWREASQKSCPRQKKTIPENRRRPGGPTWEWFHFVNNV